MFKRLDNNRGVALLMVMIIMTVLVIVGSLVLTMASSESRMVDDYGNHIRAFYIAEAGADLAIKLWDDYIYDTLQYDEYGALDENSINNLIDDFIVVLAAELNKPDGLADQLKNRYDNGKNIEIEYQDYNPPDGKLNHSSKETPDEPHILTITVDGTYDDTEYRYGVQLWYFLNKTTGSCKGLEVLNKDAPGDTAPPAIVSTDPVDGATDVPVEQTVTVTFSEPVQEGTEFASIMLEKDPGGNPVEVSKAVNGTRLTLEPVHELAEHTPYIVTVPRHAVKDAAGNSFMGNCDFSFTTGGAGGGSIPGDPGFAYFDIDLDYQYDSDIDISVPKAKLEKGDINTLHRLIIPASVGPVNARGNNIYYQAEYGIYVGVDLTNSAHRSIKLESASGDITVAGGVTLNPSKKLTIEADAGNIIIDGATLKSKSSNDISLDAGTSISMVNTYIQSTGGVTINAARDIEGEGVTIISHSNGSVLLDAAGAIDICEASISSAKNVEIESREAINARGSTITSSSNGYITIETENSGSDIILNGATLNSSNKIGIASRGFIYANNALLDSSFNAGTSMVALAGIQLASTQLPASGPLSIIAGGEITAESATMSSTGNNEIDLRAVGNITVQSAGINASGFLSITSAGEIIAGAATMTSGGWKNIEIQAGGDISVQSADINASKDLKFIAGAAENTIYVANAQFRDRDNVAEARPAGVKIEGTPAFGSIDNGSN